MSLKISYLFLDVHSSSFFKLFYPKWVHSDLIENVDQFWNILLVFVFSLFVNAN